MASCLPDIQNVSLSCMPCMCSQYYVTIKPSPVISWLTAASLYKPGDTSLTLSFKEGLGACHKLWLSFSSHCWFVPSGGDGEGAQINAHTDYRLPKITHDVLPNAFQQFYSWKNLGLRQEYNIIEPTTFGYRPTAVTASTELLVYGIHCLIDQIELYDQGKWRSAVWCNWVG